MKNTKYKITHEFEFEFEDGKRTINMESKDISDIEDCDVGKIISLLLHNNECYTGVFKGIDEDDIMIKTSNGTHTIGVKTYWVKSYLEEI
jgi:hypothetical protein